MSVNVDESKWQERSASAAPFIPDDSLAAPPALIAKHGPPSASGRLDRFIDNCQPPPNPPPHLRAIAQPQRAAAAQAQYGGTALPRRRAAMQPRNPSPRHSCSTTLTNMRVGVGEPRGRLRERERSRPEAGDPPRGAVRRGHLRSSTLNEYACWCWRGVAGPSSDHGGSMAS